MVYMVNEHTIGHLQNLSVHHDMEIFSVFAYCDSSFGIKGAFAFGSMPFVLT
jgi:hypothetical protein